MINLKIEKSKNENEWNDFLFNSINKNIYCHSDFINSLEGKFSKFLVKKNKEIVASFFLQEKEKNIKLSNETIYTPLIFKNYKNRSTSSLNTEKFEITNFFKKFLIDNYIKIDYISDYHLNDLRPFYFHNFDKKEEVFSIKFVNYTTLLQIQDINKELDFQNSKFYKNLSVRLRQQYNYSFTRKKYNLIEGYEKEIFKDLVKKTFARQNLKVDFDIDTRSILFEKLNKSKNIKMYYALEDKIVKSFALFGLINDHAVYLHGGRSGEEKNDYSLTHTLIQSFVNLNKNGINSIDLEGINSPNRGFYKLGYGGTILPYYHVAKLK
jgi:hypothetical protein